MGLLGCARPPPLRLGAPRSPTRALPVPFCCRTFLPEYDTCGHGQGHGSAGGGLAASQFVSKGRWFDVSNGSCHRRGNSSVLFGPFFRTGAFVMQGPFVYSPECGGRGRLATDVRPLRYVHKGATELCTGCSGFLLHYGCDMGRYC